MKSRVKYSKVKAKCDLHCIGYIYILFLFCFFLNNDVYCDRSSVLLFNRPRPLQNRCQRQSPTYKLGCEGNKNTLRYIIVADANICIKYFTCCVR